MSQQEDSQQKNFNDEMSSDVDRNELPTLRYGVGNENIS